MDYEFKTTFWLDFTIADAFGTTAVEDTYKRAFDEWHDNTEYITELCLVLNWKIWQHHVREDEKSQKLARLYDRLYFKLYDWCSENLEGDDLSYFYSTLD